MYTRTAVKLACKAVFVYIFTSDGHPMLLDWLYQSRRYPARRERLMSRRE